MSWTGFLLTDAVASSNDILTFVVSLVDVTDSSHPVQIVQQSVAEPQLSVTFADATLQRGGIPLSAGVSFQACVRAVDLSGSTSSSVCSHFAIVVPTSESASGDVCAHYSQ